MVQKFSTHVFQFQYYPLLSFNNLEDKFEGKFIHSNQNTNTEKKHLLLN